MSTAVDFTYVEQAGITVLSVVLTVAVPLLVTKAAQWLHIQTNDTMRGQLDTAATNAGALVLDMLKRGAMQHHTIAIGDPTVAKLASEVMDNLPRVVTALGITPDTVQALIVKKFALLNATNPPAATTTTTSLEHSDGTSTSTVQTTVTAPSGSAAPVPPPVPAGTA